MSGKVCLTFDDGVYTQWIPVLPLFKQHHAHATFSSPERWMMPCWML